MLYKLETGTKKLVFATDIEPVDDFAKDLKDFICDSDVLIHDAQYLDEDYNSKIAPTKGYGHSTFDMAVQNAVECNTKKLFLFHHNPLYSDEKLEGILGTVRKKFKNSFLARELDKNIL
jgi:ribonuclease BN (tRNA processing enzyme)